MAFEQRENQGVLFKNLDRREGENNFPHAKGRAKIGGVEYWIAAWTKTDKKGDKFQSLAFTPMEQQQHPQDSGDQRRRPPRAQEPLQGLPKPDDCPF